MGYTTEFEGRITVSPPLNAEERRYLKKFAKTRRVHRRNGPYYVGATGFMGQDHMGDEIDYNAPPPGQPSLWCQWVPSEDGTAIVWDGGEKFYSAVDWMRYIIDHFLKPGAEAQAAFGRLGMDAQFGGHQCNGVIHATGEDQGDVWSLVVENNVVRKVDGHVQRVAAPPVRQRRPINLG
jgi:hypothetical protein